jgi:hypothetical protein
LAGLVIILNCNSTPQNTTQSWIRINQLGYLPHATKVAVLASKGVIQCTGFELIDAQTNQPVWNSTKAKSKGAYGTFTQTYRLDFSDFQNDGLFYLTVGQIKSPVFKINNHVYDGAADFLLKYMRQQRCGFNPFLNDSCHTHDGYTIYGPMPDGTYIDVVGGWHDAADYLQYVTTSANAAFNLLFAYRENPGSFEDKFDALSPDWSEAIWITTYVQNVSKSVAVERAARYLAGAGGWYINTIDKESGVISASQAVGYGKGKTNPLNVSIESVKNGVNVSISWSSSSHEIARGQMIQNTFCSIIEAIGK